MLCLLSVKLMNDGCKSLLGFSRINVLAVFFIAVAHACGPLRTDSDAVNAGTADKNLPSRIYSQLPYRHLIRSGMIYG
jgi:hypothetical protein